MRTEVLIAQGAFAKSPEWVQIQDELRAAVRRVTWPPGNNRFTIHPQSGRKRGEGNGVKPIKEAFVEALEDFGWEPEQRLRIGTVRSAGKIDVIKRTPYGIFAVEWETGNISSSHRSMNKLALGIIQNAIVGGCIVLPTREMYRYLTDRVGNFRELEPYFPLWQSVVT
ncbi:MAG TPA: hypothetical protein VF212_02670, partial [Longimicrobiales bacterium]